MLLFYVRHGDPTYEPDGLTPLGKRQAEGIGRRLAAFGVDEIYASSSVRAQETARPLCEMLHKQATVLDWCNESHAWEELTVKRGNSTKWLSQVPEYLKIFASPQMYAYGEEWYNHGQFCDPRFKKGINRIKKETYALIKNLGYEYDESKNLYKAIAPNDKRVALFAHEGFGVAFLSAVLGIPYPVFAARFHVEHSAMSVIHFSPEYTDQKEIVPQLLQFSNDSHLYREGLPTSYNNGIRF